MAVITVKENNYVA
ncbi:hypothetical protein IE994_20485 [Enterobacter hormaechei]|nr:hypothetical protein [Enterobacter hormaechei]